MNRIEGSEIARLSVSLVRVAFLTGVAILMSLTDGSAFTFSVSIPAYPVSRTDGVVEGPPVNIFAIHPAALDPWPPSAGFLNIGETVQLQLKAIFDDLHEEDITHGLGTEYSSVDTAVVSVDSGGIVTAVGPGETFVLVRFREADCAIRASVRANAMLGGLSGVFNLYNRSEFDPSPPANASIQLSPGMTATLDAFAAFADGKEELVSGNSSFLLTSFNPNAVHLSRPLDEKW
ncbi:MAG: hypothetical protein HZB91_02070 [Elusimicrobia bacterium]|nr:hypothetical protein [Elusimicrobiota bacterium]